MKFAKINVNRGSSFFEKNGQSFLVKKEYSNSVDLDIDGHTIMFQNSEVLLKNVAELDYLDEVEEGLSPCSEHYRIVYIKILDRFRDYYQNELNAIDFPDLDKYKKFFGLGKNHFLIKALSILK